MTAGRGGVLRRMREDAGAVAILVALCMSTFLLAFAAFAVDLGQVYTRKGGLQNTADLAALDAAVELPDAGAARAKAVRAVCDPATAAPDWLDGAVCPDSRDDESVWREHDFAADPPEWAANDDLADGGVVVFGEDADEDGRYEDAERLRAGGEARAIRVVLPPTTVEFGFAKTFGADSMTLGKAATARIATPVGMGVLPFAARHQDVAEGTDHRFCVKDPQAVGTTLGRPTRPAGWLPVVLDLPLDRSLRPGEELRIGRWVLPDFPAGTPTVHVLPAGGGLRRTLDVVSATQRQIVARVPLDVPPATYNLWVEWPGPPRFVSYSTAVAVAAAPVPPVPDPCAREDAERGVLDVGRQDGDGEPEAMQVLADNLKAGIKPTPHRFDEYPDALLTPVVNPMLGLVGLRCFEVPLLQPILSTLAVYEPDINCAWNRPHGFSAGLTAGLLDDDPGSPGRLQRQCSDETTGARDFGEIDGTDLFSDDSPLVDRRVSLGDDLAEALRSGDEPRRGWISGRAFRCPRLGLVPVMNPDIPSQDEDNPILGFTYAWIEDDESGPVFVPGSDDRLQAVRAFAVDPGYFPEVVSGSPKVTDYLGDDFPKQAQLVPDVTDP